MTGETLRIALEREHRQIDRGIETTIAELPNGNALTTPLAGAMQALRRHIYLEEEFLFPPMREAGMTMPILVMLREHGELWRTMDAIDALLDDGADPGRMLDCCRELLAQLDQHNSKEEPVIYPLADAALSAEAYAELSTFLQTGQTPEGWVCQQAQSGSRYDTASQ